MRGEKRPRLLRLRHWLIRKLGGYVEQLPPETILACVREAAREGYVVIRACEGEGEDSGKKVQEATG